MEKIKLFIESDKGKDTLILIIIILIALGSFELGRLSNEGGSKGIKIEYPAESTSKEPNTILSDNLAPNSDILRKSFFASNKGTKYYTISCSAGKTIKQENRIYFTKGEEAVAAGYTLSSSCN
ncbi:MAG: hypothetical protein WCP17_01675 [bacterium]